MASAASRTFSCASASDVRAASTTQCDDVVLEQAEADGLQCLGDGGDLGEDVDAVGVLFDHPLQTRGPAPRCGAAA